MLKLSALQVLPVWVAPDHLAETARYVAEGHGMTILSVLDGSKVLGFVTLQGLSAARPQARVSDLIQPFVTEMEAETSVRSAASDFIRLDLTAAPVITHGRFMGVVTANQLLRELNRDADALTGLRRLDDMREWAIGELRRGNEISVIHLDVTDFRQFNRNYGFEEGDRALQSIANHMQKGIDPKREDVARYGGDEFVLFSLRNRAETEALATTLIRGAADVSGTELRLAYGVAGGRRLKMREATHYPSNLDNLLQLAVADRAAKRNEAPEAEVAQAAAEKVITSLEPQNFEAISQVADSVPKASESSESVSSLTLQDRPVVRLISFPEEENLGAATQVLLRFHDRLVGGIDDRAGSAEPLETPSTVALSVARATARALQTAFPNVFIEVIEAGLFDGPEGESFGNVKLTIRGKGRAVTETGAFKVGDEPNEAIAEATFQAFAKADLG